MLLTKLSGLSDACVRAVPVGSAELFQLFTGLNKNRILF